MKQRAASYRRRSKLWPRFLRDRRGVSAIEFGLIAVPFLGLLLAILDTGLYFVNAEGLEAAVQDAARNIMTGQAQGGSVSSSSQFINTYVCPTTGGRILPSFIDCSKLIVDVRPATSFATADMSDTFYQNPSSLQFCPGAPGAIVVVRVAYPMPAMVPLLGFASYFGATRITAGLVNDVPNDPGWKHLIIGTAVFQTEPFPGTSYTAPTGC